MADRSLIVRTFNDLFFELLDDVIKILPGSAGLKTARRAFQFLSSVGISLYISNTKMSFFQVILRFFLKKIIRRMLSS